MKVLLYLTLALCIAQAYSFTCTNSTQLSVNSNCAAILNPLIMAGSYNYFDLTQLGFTVANIDAGLGTFFSEIAMSPLCAQAQANLKSLACQTLYPTCAVSVSANFTPAIPCNDLFCGALLGSSLPGSFVNGSGLYNPAFGVAPFNMIGLAYQGVASGFVSALLQFFGATANASFTGCQNLGLLQTFFAGIAHSAGVAANESLSCPTITLYAQQPSYPTDSCPCMPYPSNTVYCTAAANGFNLIPAIYGLPQLNASIIELQVQMGVNAQLAMFTGVGCPSCNSAIQKFACSTAFLQCTSATNSATALQFPCQAVGQNLINACSLNAIIQLFNNPANPNPGLIATLNATVNQANALPSSNCAVQSFVNDSVCPCVTLSPAVLSNCSAFVNYPVATFLNNSLIAQTALNASSMNLGLLAAYTCPTCVNQLAQFACLSAFPQCIAGGPVVVPLSQQFCNDTLNTCRFQQLASPLIQGLLKVVTLIVPSLKVPSPALLTSLLNLCGNLPPLGFLPMNYTAPMPCPCGPVPASSKCAQYIKNPVAPFLANLDDTTRGTLEAAVLAFDAGANAGACMGCLNAVDQNLCTIAYPSCNSSALVILSCASTCSSSVSFCPDSMSAQGICTGPLAAGLGADGSCIPLNNQVANATCPIIPSHAAGLIAPSFFFVAITLLLVLFF
jgi:hypothetical protein